MSGQIPFLISHPLRAKGQRSTKPALPPAVRPQDSPGKHSLYLPSSLFQCKDGEGREGEKRKEQGV